MKEPSHNSPAPGATPVETPRKLIFFLMLPKPIHGEILRDILGGNPAGIHGELHRETLDGILDGTSEGIAAEIPRGIPTGITERIP